MSAEYRSAERLWVAVSRHSQQPGFLRNRPRTFGNSGGKMHGMTVGRTQSAGLSALFPNSSLGTEKRFLMFGGLQPPYSQLPASSGARGLARYVVTSLSCRRNDTTAQNVSIKS